MADYRFVDKSPQIDLLRGEMARYGSLNHAQIAKLAYAVGCHPGTIHNWLFGKTRIPNGLIMQFALQELSLKIQYVREDGTTVRQPQMQMKSKADQDKILRADAERQAKREKKKAKGRKTK